MSPVERVLQLLVNFLAPLSRFHGFMTAEVDDLSVT